MYLPNVQRAKIGHSWGNLILFLVIVKNKPSFASAIESISSISEQENDTALNAYTGIIKVNEVGRSALASAPL